MDEGQIMTNPNYLSSVQPAIKRFFCGGDDRGQIYRSGTGFLLAAILLPALLGVMACFPAPVGNPERSRIDPMMTGMWLAEDAIIVLDPWDKRTWVMSYFEFSVKGDSEQKNPDESDENPSEEETPLIELLRENQLEIDSFSICKTWLTKIKGELFITWESKSLTDRFPDVAPEQWWVFRVRKKDVDELSFDMFNLRYDGFDDIETRSQAEKYIRRHMNDPEFFSDGDEFIDLHKIPESDYEAASEMMEEFGISGFD
jgi:hypothetical protein